VIASKSAKLYTSQTLSYQDSLLNNLILLLIHINCFSWINKKTYSSTLKDKIITGNLYPETYKLAVLEIQLPRLL